MVAANVQEARRRLAKHYVEAVSEFQAMYLLGGDNAVRAVAAFDVEREQLESWFDWLVKKSQHDAEAAALILQLLTDSSVILNVRMNWRDLKVWYEQGLPLAQREDNTAAEAAILLMLGASAMESGEPDRSEEVLRRACDRARATGDVGILGRCLKMLGTLLETLGKFEESDAALIESLDLLRQAHLPRELASVLWDLGWNACMSGAIEQAERYNQEAYDLIYRDGDYNLLSHGQYMFGVTAYFKKDYDQCIVHYRAGLDYAQLARNQRRRLNILSIMATAYEVMGDYASCDAYNFEALQLAQQLGAERVVPSVLANLGISKVVQGDFVAARAYQERALPLFMNFKMERQVVSTMGALSSTYVNLELYADALSTLREAFAIAERLSTPPNQGQMLINAAHLWLSRAVKLGDLRHVESALRCYGLVGTGDDIEPVIPQIRQLLPEVEALIGAERVALLIAEGAQRELADLFSEVKLLVDNSD